MLADKQLFADTRMPPATLTPNVTDEVTRHRAAIIPRGRWQRPTEAAAELTPTQISVLMTVVSRETVRLGDLAAIEGLNPTMLSRVLAVLVDRGLVKRVADPDDRRAALLASTASGRKVRERMRKERSAKLEPVLAALSDAERQSIVDALPALEQLGELLREQARQ
jgi:DNA-binding MarR family transcriptional regulator